MYLQASTVTYCFLQMIQIQSFVFLQNCLEIATVGNIHFHVCPGRMFCLPERGGTCSSRSTKSAAERPFKGAKAGPPQLEPLTSLLEREASDSTEATARQSSFSSFTKKKEKKKIYKGIAFSVTLQISEFVLKQDSFTFFISEISAQTLISYFTTKIQMSCLSQFIHDHTAPTLI